MSGLVLGPSRADRVTELVASSGSPKCTIRLSSDVSGFVGDEALPAAIAYHVNQSSKRLKQTDVQQSSKSANQAQNDLYRSRDWHSPDLRHVILLIPQLVSSDQVLFSNKNSVPTQSSQLILPIQFLKRRITRRAIREGDLHVAKLVRNLGSGLVAAPMATRWMFGLKTRISGRIVVERVPSGKTDDRRAITLWVEKRLVGVKSRNSVH